MTIFETLVFARWLHFAALFVLFGSSLFWLTVGRVRWRSEPLGLSQSFRATIVLLRISASLAAVSGIVWLAGILANITGAFTDVFDPATLRLFFFETPFGLVAVIRLALLAVIVVVTLLPWRNRVWLMVILGLSAALLVNQAWFGHAARGGMNFNGAIAIFTYAIHVLAGGAWVGSLPCLAFVLAEQYHRRPREDLLRLLLRYSLLAATMVTAIFASGIANTVFRTDGSFGRLLGTSYGDLLAAKVAVAMVMLALACFSRFVAMPRLLEAKGGALRVQNLRGRVIAELVLGILVIGIAAILGITPPA